MILLDVTIPIEPRGKGRPKFSTFGGFPRAYTDKETVAFERTIAMYLKNAWHRPPHPGPLAVMIEGVATRPGKPPGPIMLKREPRLAGRLWRTTKPDLDNVTKAILDAGNAAGIWTDDKVVSKIEAYSLTAATTEGPSIRIVVSELPEFP